jgi:hypothetical protein
MNDITVRPKAEYREKMRREMEKFPRGAPTGRGPSALRFPAP